MLTLSKQEMTASFHVNASPCVTGEPLNVNKIEDALAIVRDVYIRGYKRIVRHALEIRSGKMTRFDWRNRRIIVNAAPIDSDELYKLAALLIHEATHGYLVARRRVFDLRAQERMCFDEELRFLKLYFRRTGLSEDALSVYMSELENYYASLMDAERWLGPLRNRIVEIVRRFCGVARFEFTRPRHGNRDRRV